MMLFVDWSSKMTHCSSLRRIIYSRYLAKSPSHLDTPDSNHLEWKSTQITKKITQLLPIRKGTHWEKPDLGHEKIAITWHTIFDFHGNEKSIPMVASQLPINFKRPDEGEGGIRWNN